MTTMINMEVIIMVYHRNDPDPCGFLMYEMGIALNTLAAGAKNILAFAYIILAFYMFGWWLPGHAATDLYRA